MKSSDRESSIASKSIFEIKFGTRVWGSKISFLNLAVIPCFSELTVSKDIHSGLNKRVLEELSDSYSTGQLGDAIDHLDNIRGLVEMRDGSDNELRNKLFKLRDGMSYLLNGNSFLTFPDENLADLAHDIEDQMFDIIEAAEAVRSALEPLLLLSAMKRKRILSSCITLRPRDRNFFEQVADHLPTSRYHACVVGRSG